MPGADGISIIVPTFGRVASVDTLLASIAVDALSRSFIVEIILADSSEGNEKEALSRLASRYGASVVTAPPNPGLARNAAVAGARLRFVLFIDSDVTLCPGAIQAHYNMLAAGADACAGLVEFTGRATSAWRTVEVMQMMLPFRYALLTSTVPWAPTANISFRKDRFLAVGGLDPALPPYGGEDVDLGFRFSDAGFRIQTSAAAVVRHTIETWARWSQNVPRLVSYGKADFYLLERYPIAPISMCRPRCSRSLCRFCSTIIIAPWVRLYSLVPLAAAILAQSLCYALLKRKEGDSLRIHVAGPLIIALLDLGKWVEAFKNRRFWPISVRLRYLHDIIEKDWREIWASSWGVYASTLVFVVVLALEFLLIFNRSR
jgi:GT2 family glycosyltransferase